MGPVIPGGKTQTHGVKWPRALRYLCSPRRPPAGPSIRVNGLRQEIILLGQAS
jgi:hypothetical protein